MREYSKVSPQFWTGDTGMKLRDLGESAQFLALYLITGPNAGVLGLYNLPLPLLCHHTGISKDRAISLLDKLSSIGFAFYDRKREEVWVPEMAHYQIAASIELKDKRHAWVVKEISNLRKFRWACELYAKYKTAYNLPEIELGSPFEGASMPHRCHKHELEQEQEQEQEQKHAEPGKPARVVELQSDIVDPLPDSTSADTYPAKATRDKARKKPTPVNTPRPPDALFDAVASVTGSDPKVSGAHIGRVVKLLKAAEPPYTPEEVRKWQEDVLAEGWLTTLPGLGLLEKTIGRVRQPKMTVGPPKKPASILERMEALQRQREGGLAS